MKFHSPDMTCGHCASVITKAIKSVDPLAEVKIDLASRVVSVESAATPATITNAVLDAGYTAHTL